MTETDWAIRNLELGGWFDKDSDYDGMIGEAVKKLLLCHQQEGHSGMSHGLTVELFRAVALDRPLTMAYWQEKYDAYNKMAIENGQDRWTEENFEKIVMKKPEIDAKSKETTQETKKEVCSTVQETPEGVRGAVEGGDST